MSDNWPLVPQENIYRFIPKWSHVEKILRHIVRKLTLQRRKIVI